MTMGTLGDKVGRLNLGSVAPSMATLLGGVFALKQAAEAQASASTLGGALTMADGLASPIAEALRSSARSAFVDGFQAAALLGTAIMVASALLAWRMLRGPVTPAGSVAVRG